MISLVHLLHHQGSSSTSLPSSLLLLSSSWLSSSVPSPSEFGVGGGICVFTSSLVFKVDRAGPSGWLTGVKFTPVETGSSPASVTFVPAKSGSSGPVVLLLSSSICNRLWFRRRRDGDGFFFLVSGAGSASGFISTRMSQNLSPLLMERLARGGNSAIMCPIASCTLSNVISIPQRRNPPTRYFSSV